MKLHDLKPTEGSRHRRRRVGRGESSGLGKTCGKGHKGQKSRSGASIRPSFEGGQMPLARRLPKKGFQQRPVQRRHFAIVNRQLTSRRSSPTATTVNEESLRACGLVKGVCDAIKVLGSGDLSKKLTVTADKLSATAREKIEKAGGSIAE